MSRLLKLIKSLPPGYKIVPTGAGWQCIHGDWVVGHRETADSAARFCREHARKSSAS